jgi:hypothetical protein
MEKGVFPMLLGGLGNQMFVMVASWVVSKEKGCPLYISSEPAYKNPHNTMKKNYMETLFYHFGINTKKKEGELINNEFRNWRIFNPPGFHPWNPRDLTLETGILMGSYFQYYPPLAPHENEIRSLFLKGLDRLPIKIGTENPETKAFLHIRRGDYLKLPHIHFIQPLSYYEKALDILKKESKKVIDTIYIFSDDIEWVKNQDIFQKEEFQIVEGLDELESLYLMSQCKGGAICGNSTFSWWGAFLGAYEIRSPVIVPKNWISDPIYSLFPPEWIVVE